MAATNSTPNRIGIDLVEPFGVSLNNIILEEHGSLLAAEEFGDRLRAALRANNPDSANIDAADLAERRLSQSLGILRSLWDSGAFNALNCGPHVGEAMDAVDTLLDQAVEAVQSLNFQRDAIN